MADVNPLEMSDEDFAKLNEPPVVEAQTTETVVTEPVVTETVVEEDKSSETVVEEKTEEVVEAGAETEAKTEDGTTEATEGGEKEVPAEVEGGKKPETVEGEKPKTEETQTQTVNYEEAYKKLMAPIRANGKDIELRSPDELIKLAQMGADYTRKLQALAPHRKTLMMLENNSLDADKLNFLIDLDRGDPEALKKFIKDKGINVLDIDTESEPEYQPSNQQVSDTEVTFKSTMEDLVSTPEGKATATEIHENWDDVSKQVLWTSPELMTTIHQQREKGPNGEKSLYDQISTEIDRRKTLGQISPTTPFLQAYKIVGDEWSAKAAQQVEEQKRVLGTSVAAPKPKVVESDKASAASATRTAPKDVKPAGVNPLAMSDDEFMKQADLMRGRL